MVKTPQKIKQVFDKGLVTEIIAKLVITFGVVLIVGGLYLMIANPNAPTLNQTSSGSQTLLFGVEWIPGIPFYTGDLANLSSVISGSAYWIVGANLLLVGLGLWARHKLARLAAIIVFSLAAFFQFIQFLLFGVLGSPLSIVELSIDLAFVYFLFSKFDFNVSQDLSK
jgi:hypothetical protein